MKNSQTREFAELNKDDARVLKIAQAIGHNGRHFSVEEIKKVDDFMFEAEVNYGIFRLIEEENVIITFDENGEMLFGIKEHK